MKQQQLKKCNIDEEESSSAYEIRRRPGTGPEVIVSTTFAKSGGGCGRAIPISASYKQNLYSSVVDAATSGGGSIDNHTISATSGLYDNPPSLPPRHSYATTTAQNVYFSRPLVVAHRSRHASRENNNFRSSSSCKIYQDVDEYDQRGFMSSIDHSNRQSSSDFKGHLV